VTVTPATLSRRRADLLAVAVLVALPALIALVTVARGRVLSPAANLLASYPWQSLGAPAVPNPALGDVAQWFHPALLWSGAEVRALRWPLWVPHAYTGAPFFANPQTALLFPLTWLAWLLPAGAALTVITAGKLLLAGLAMYWFLRVGLRLGAIAALVAALGFEFSTTLVGWIGWAFGSTIAVLPLLFGAVERVREPARRRDVAVLALAVALHVLAGYPQATLHALLAVSAWALARARGADRGFLVRCALGGGLGLALAAVQVVPFVEYVVESAVWAYRRQWMAPLAVPATSAITALMPYALGGGADGWGRWQFNIVATHAGLVPLLLAPLGIVAGWRRPGGRFFAGFVLVLAAIHYGLPGGATLASLPGLALGSNLRLMPHLVFGLCVLGALGVDAIARGEASPAAWPVRAWFVVLALGGFAWVAGHLSVPGAQSMRWPLAVQLAVALAGLTLAATLALGWIQRGAIAWGGALVVLQVVSVVPPAWAYLPTLERRWLYPDTPVLAWLRAQPERGRVIMPGHVGFLYGIAEAHGYDGLTPRRIAELVGSLGTGTGIVHGYLQSPLEGVGSEALSPAAVLTSSVVDLLGVRYVMLPPGAPAPSPDLRLDYDGRDARVFVNPRALPRALLIGRARCVDDATAVRELRAQSIDPHTEVLLADCATPPASGASVAGAVEIRVDEPERLRVITTAPAPAWLVVTDTWYPGWRGYLDDREVLLWRADHAFRAVAVPAGAHEIELRFRPRSVLVGGVVSALAGAIIVALLVTRPRPEAVRARSSSGARPEPA
jgi:hypothetical protein